MLSHSTNSHCSRRQHSDVCSPYRSLFPVADPRNSSKWFRIFFVMGKNQSVTRAALNFLVGRVVAHVPPVVHHCFSISITQIFYSHSPIKELFSTFDTSSRVKGDVLVFLSISVVLKMDFFFFGPDMGSNKHCIP